MASTQHPTQTILQMGEVFRKKIEPTRTYVASEELTLTDPTGIYLRESRIGQCITFIFGVLIIAVIFMSYFRSGLPGNPADFLNFLEGGQVKFSERLSDPELNTTTSSP